MESELAKTLRSMSDDHRMVPDFSEQLLDIADAIERLQKERDEGWANALRAQAERDAALVEVERLKAELRGIYSDQAASDQARIEIRRKSDAMGR